MSELVCSKCKNPLVRVEYCPSCHHELRIKGISPDPHGEHKVFSRLARQAADLGGLEVTRLKWVDYYSFSFCAMVKLSPLAEGSISSEDRIKLAEENYLTRDIPWLKFYFQIEPEAER